jgi:DNA transformation protein
VANSPDFVAHVLELMEGSGRVAARAMFGGHGVYVDGMIVGIVVADVLYLKTDEATMPCFRERGQGAFEYKTKKGIIQGTSYHRPPDEALESPAAMREWLRLALAAALRAPARKVTSHARTKRAR